jgi:hypothetical protein
MSESSRTAAASANVETLHEDHDIEQDDEEGDEFEDDNALDDDSQREKPHSRVWSDNKVASVTSKANSAVKDYEAFYKEQFDIVRTIDQMEAADF